MSQQQMPYHEVNRDGPHASYGEYEGLPHYQHDASNASGQKLAGQSSGWTHMSPSTGQRLALAIVSLVLLFLAFMASILSMTSYNGGVQVMAMVGFIVFFIAVIIINGIFNTKH